MTTHFRFQKRIAPAPYEHEELEVNFSVEQGENLEEKVLHHKNLVYKALKGTIESKSTSPNTTSQSKTEKPQGESHGQEDSKESGKKGSKKSSKESSEEVTTPASETTPAPAETKSEPKSEKTKAKKADEGIPYDCENKDHKSTLSNFLTKLTGSKDWAKDKEKSVKISKEVLHGQPFLAKDGTVLGSFEALCKEQFGASSDVL